MRYEDFSITEFDRRWLMPKRTTLKDELDADSWAVFGLLIAALTGLVKFVVEPHIQDIAAFIAPLI